jgi:Beta-galactosidase second all-beta domain
MGQYDNQLGPQHEFYVPAGILDQQGQNTIAIATWGPQPTGGGLGSVTLVSLGDQAGGVAAQPVIGPAYSPATYGRP